MIIAKICCAMNWSYEMHSFCGLNYFDFVKRNSDLNLHFYRKIDNHCNHWTVLYNKWTNTFDILGFEISIQTSSIINITKNNFTNFI